MTPWDYSLTTNGNHAKEGNRSGQKEETYSMVAAHGYYSQLIFPCACFNKETNALYKLNWPSGKLTTLCLANREERIYKTMTGKQEEKLLIHQTIYFWNVKNKETSFSKIF